MAFFQLATIERHEHQPTEKWECLVALSFAACISGISVLNQK